VAIGFNTVRVRTFIKILIWSRHLLSYKCLISLINRNKKLNSLNRDEIGNSSILGYINDS
jgi:hypothetical protein